MAGTQSKMQGAGIGGNESQATPSRNESVVLGAFDQPVVEFGDRGQRQLGARLRKGLLGNTANQLRLLLEVAEEGVQFGLDAFAHPGEHQRDNGRQRQLATARERCGVLGVAG